MSTAVNACSGAMTGSRGAGLPRAREKTSTTAEIVNATQASQLVYRTAARNNVPSSGRVRVAVT